MVLTGRRAEVFREAAPLALARRLAEECVAVGRAEGAQVGRDTVEEIVERIAALPPDQGTSMLYDKLAGRRLEWDARNGVIARLGAHHGIPTPVSDRVTAELAALDEPASGSSATCRPRDRMPAPPGKDADRRNPSRGFKWSRTPHGGDRRPPIGGGMLREGPLGSRS